ncbi:NADH-quinone oxidoreductase subunit A [Enterobacteriaceae endosymbiont of Donacia tomentosa]|uniref:NADH-quinone oxidoreductase subunit A n=1 Tax=Enterobacteriaceae endosymbiont of Donacia tomentosa TaxID=2675787 RepID=UPI0014496832|nr:NADH-quinone oxidoreductase subunit A [Enterobacteriaceae endosymbiont of Donacia tomentosa]QJC31801.1 NADH-quinone oxidoreductase subunit A [Enterobacteriaceae endosymbiont of Donacia tomentosa]
MIKNNIIFNYWYFIIFQITAIIISSFMILISFFLGGRSYGLDKHLPFESGADSFGDSKIKIHIHFYLIAIFFIIFDIESLYLYLWSVSIKSIQSAGFIEGVLFILNILISLFYLFKLKALDWQFIKHTNKNKI